MQQTVEGIIVLAAVLLPAATAYLSAREDKKKVQQQ